jgi:hypothetical protein
MSLKGTVWAPIGPSPMAEGSGTDNGLVTAIAVNPNNQNVLYVGTAQGGVWRSGDAGDTWTPLFDRQFSLGIGEPGGIAIDPSNTNILYVGTSSGDSSAEPGTIRQRTAGLFKSTDGGASWIAMGSGFPVWNTGNANQFVNQNINVILVDPANAVIYVGSTTGVFTSTDGGQNWTGAAGIGAVDTRSLALDLSTPPNARILYAGVSGSGVFRSNDGGSTFSQILSATTPAVATALGASTFTRVVVALAPPTSPPNVNGVQVIYVTMAGGYGATVDPVGVFISNDQGGTWTQQTAAGISGTTYGGYALDMAVDPASPGDGINDVLYFGCQNQFRSSDSGVTFSSHGVGHADTHTWTCVAQTGGAKTVVYCGCDGGIDVSTDAGSTWTSKNGGGLQTGLFYNIAIKPDATASVTVGALQDNELQTTAGAASPTWNATFGGDGWDIAYDGSSPPVLYGASGGPATSIFSSTNDGASFTTNNTPPWTSVDTGGFLLTQIAADPSASGIIYASGNQNLWQLRGGSWRIIAAPGSSGNVDVAPADGNNVVIAAGTQVYVSTNALAATVGLPSGVTFANITRNLPGRNVARAVFDPIDPTVIYAVLTGFDGGIGSNVFRTTVGATSWTNISPALDLPCGAIAVDGTTTPTTLYVGTDLGVIRSVDAGASWSVLDDIHFPRAPVFDLAFNAKAGVLRAATYGRGVFEFVKPAGPAIALNLEDGLAFGTACVSRPRYLSLQVYNVGAADLVITSVARLLGSADFTVLSAPGTPLSISPGEEVDFTLRFAPSVPNTSEAAIIRVISNDPTAPFVDVTATGLSGSSKVATVIANSGSFGNVCLGSFVDETLIINNAGTCPLLISGIVGSADFLAPSVAAYPLMVGSGDSLELVVRFQPASYGVKFGSITIISNDPAGPRLVSVSGVAQAPKANLIIANTGNFGNVCVGSFVDEPLVVTNSGKCTLSVTSIISTSPEFLVPEVLSYPVTIGSGNSLSVPIRFQPTGFGVKTAAIVVSSDDPASPLSIDVSGTAPSGKLVVAGSTTFGGVTACCCADRTLSLCNVGDCALNVISVHFRRRSRHWKLLHNPFPAKLRAGSCLPLTIQYHATEKCSRIFELVIESDDPVTPVRVIELRAYTIWDSCCKEDCDDCRKGCCDKHHRDPSCRQGYPSGCDDDDDDGDDDEEPRQV